MRGEIYEFVRELPGIDRLLGFSKLPAQAIFPYRVLLNHWFLVEVASGVIGHLPPDELGGHLVDELFRWYGDPEATPESLGPERAALGSEVARVLRRAREIRDSDAELIEMGVLGSDEELTHLVNELPADAFRERVRQAIAIQEVREQVVTWLGRFSSGVLDERLSSSQDRASVAGPIARAVVLGDGEGLNRLLDAGIQKGGSGDDAYLRCLNREIPTWLSQSPHREELLEAQRFLRGLGVSQETAQEVLFRGLGVAAHIAHQERGTFAIADAAATRRADG
jgi:hypothetical protein